VAATGVTLATAATFTTVVTNADAAITSAKTAYDTEKAKTTAAEDAVKTQRARVEGLVTYLAQQTAYET